MSQNQNVMEVDIWLRGTTLTTTHPLEEVPSPASDWSDADVRGLLVEMLLALERVRNPGGPPPPVSLRGFSWIVSPATQGVLVHLEMQSGTASAGPFAIGEERLAAMISRVMNSDTTSSTVVH